MPIGHSLAPQKESRNFDNTKQQERRHKQLDVRNVAKARCGEHAKETALAWPLLIKTLQSPLLKQNREVLKHTPTQNESRSLVPSSWPFVPHSRYRHQQPGMV